MKNIGVHISYKNSKLETVCSKTYTLEEYTQMMHSDQIRLISDVEDMAYRLNHGRPKNEWTDDSWAAFCCIKHKLLDKAGEIERLPQNIVERRCSDTDVDDFDSLISRAFGDKT